MLCAGTASGKSPVGVSSEQVVLLGSLVRVREWRGGILSFRLLLLWNVDSRIAELMTTRSDGCPPGGIRGFDPLGRSAPPNNKILVF
jgi:hypothetical protein